MRKGFLGSLLVSIFALAVMGGCPFMPPTGDTGNNSGFNNAAKITLDANRADFTGTISPAGDFDMYSIGDLAVGDRLVIEVTRTSGNLDPVLAVFDRNQAVHGFNDDRSPERLPDNRHLDPRLDMTIRGNPGEFFVGVAGFPGSQTTGAYRVQIVVTPDGGVATPNAQTVYFNWIGGRNVTVRNVGTFNIDPFDATDVGLASGSTNLLKRSVENVVADRYNGFALTIVSSDFSPRPSEPHSTIFFGGTNRQAFAIAEQIDTQNSDPGDDAILFSSSFRTAFSQTPTVSRMATAMGNTVAHEIGHLLGLVHTRDCRGLMDTTCGNDAILIEQTFRTSPLDSSVFPVGFQNERELIEWAIGLAG